MATKSKSVPRSIRRAYPKVTQIIDAHHAIQVEVMKQDCKAGEALSSTECALAKAVKRQFKADAAVIGLGASYIIKGNKATRFHTPERVRREIVSFDRHRDFEEGSYTLTRKSPANRLGRTHRAKPDSRHRHDASSQRTRHIPNARVRVLNTGN